MYGRPWFCRGRQRGSGVGATQLAGEEINELIDAIWEQIGNDAWGGYTSDQVIDKRVPTN